MEIISNNSSSPIDRNAGKVGTSALNITGGSVIKNYAIDAHTVRKYYMLDIRCLLILFILLCISLSVLPDVYAAAGKVCEENYICACGAPCHLTYESLNGFNTINNCNDGSDRSDYEYVEEMIINDLNGTNFKGGDRVSLYVQYKCYVGDYVSIAYTNHSNGTSTVWRNIYSGKCPVYNFWDFYLNHTIDDNDGYHAFRAIIAYPGQSNMLCGGAYASSDTDDVAFYVNEKPDTSAPLVTGISPASGVKIEYTAGLEIPITVNATDLTAIDKVYASIRWSGGASQMELVRTSGTTRNGRYAATLFDLTNITRYNITIVINDTLGNKKNYTTYFYINNDASINISSPVFSYTYPYNNLSLGFRIIDNNTPYSQITYNFNSGGIQQIDYTSATGVINNISQSADPLPDMKAYSNNGTVLAQSFITPSRIDVQYVQLRLRKYSSDSTDFDVAVQIRSDSSGPAGMIAEKVFNTASISSDTFGWVAVQLDSVVTLQNNTKYWIYITSSDAAHNLYWEFNSDIFSGESYQNASSPIISR